MFVPEDDAGDTELNKIQVQNRIQFDGRLVAPIDLTLENVHKIILDPLGWNNLEDPPTKMKITNTGETVIVSGKWGKQRPYVTGGPLVGNYVFSQIHFHWGQNEHEGSEHTVRGIAYPMEMHVVLFKSRYLTQEAALKHEDGVVILNYLVKLTNKSSSSLQWLANNLQSIEQPKSYLMLDPAPLSSILVPMTRDYLIYWGALVTDHCSHTIMWIISRAALAITAEDLNKFRRLQNTRSESMTKNFREATHQQGRMVFHANPLTDCGNLLLPGTVEPPGKPLVVNYSHMPELDPRLATTIFSPGVGDCNVKINDELPTKTSDEKNIKLRKKLKKDRPQEGKNTLKLRNNSVDSGSIKKTVKNRASSMSPSRNMQKRNLLKETEKEKKITQNESQQCRQMGEGGVKVKGKKDVTANKGIKKEEMVNICISKVSLSADSNGASTTKKEHELKAPKIVSKSPEFTQRTKQNVPKTHNKKSQLPIPKNTKCLQSSLAQYFKPRPESSSSERHTQKVMNKPPTPKPKPIVTSIPKPIGINAGKLNTNKNGTSPQ